MMKKLYLLLFLCLAHFASFAQEETNRIKFLTIEKGLYLEPLNRFNSHWAGFEVGILNFFNDQYQFADSKEYDYLTIHPEKTMFYSINFIELSAILDRRKKHWGISSGLALEWNSLSLKKNIDLYKDDDNRLQADMIPKDVRKYKKNKLNMAYFTLPIMLEFQQRIGSEKLYLNLGVTGSIRGWSKQRQKYYDGGQKRKLKVRNDFNLSPFRYGLRAGIGYGRVGLVVSYSLVPLFDDSSAPKIYPIAFALHLL
ncbi:MAG: hypothetical protein CSB06_03930 [Bacteroidia bacterium]|nr:MAG: hypothetical protein CSB06_03930 [Bacteroidia bacterium]